MGKRKSRAKPPPKRTPGKVPTVFDCPYCNNEKVVEVKINRETQTAVIRCTKCAVNWETKAEALSQPIDVFCEWIDACEKANAD